MLLKISTNDLKIGMYTVDPNIPDAEARLIYHGEGSLHSETEIKGIRNQGYLVAFVETERSPLLDFSQLSTSIDLNKTKNIPTVEYSKERLKHGIKTSIHSHETAIETARKVIADLNKVRIRAKQVDGVVSSILTSVSDHPSLIAAITSLHNKTPYIYAHSVNVMVYSSIFGEFLGFSPTQLEQLGLAAFFHDVGKLALPESLQDTPRQLTHEESILYQTHPRKSINALRIAYENLPDAIFKGVLEHHERFNGTGFPSQKHTDEISPYGMVISLADTYDVLSNRNAPRAALAAPKAMAMIYEQRGKDFPTPIVERFVRCLGVYPAGSLVELSTKQVAVIHQIFHEALLRPGVLVIRDSMGRRTAPFPLYLTKHPELSITRVLDPIRLGIDTEAALLSYLQAKG